MGENVLDRASGPWGRARAVAMRAAVMVAMEKRILMVDGMGWVIGLGRLFEELIEV